MENFISSLRAFVRPFIAYVFAIVFVILVVIAFHRWGNENLALAIITGFVTMTTAIIAFYFGERAGKTKGEK